MNNYKNEIIEALNLYSKDNDYSDIKNYFVNDDNFNTLYKCNLYCYLRVSTTQQEFGRQIIELYEYLKKQNLKICIDNIYCDKFTGKRLNRQAYQSMREIMKKNDYFIVAEISRLGRNWDDIKKEWYKLKSEDINLLVMDFGLLSSPLPNEENETMTIDKKFMQESVFNGVLYAACKKIQEVSTSTKAGLKKAKLQGKKLGKPRNQYSTKENFINTLEKMINENIGQLKACLWTRYPSKSFQNDLKKCYNKYNTKDYQEILNKIKEDNTEWERF